MCVRPAKLKAERERRNKKNEHCVAYGRRRTSREKQRVKERKRIDQKMTMRVGNSVDMRIMMV
jgi:hypothetical protein